MTKEQYEKLKEWIKAAIIDGQDGCKDWSDKREKELDKLMGFDSTHSMEPNRYKDWDWGRGR